MKLTVIITSTMVDHPIARLQIRYQRELEAHRLISSALLWGADPRKGI
jgi:hypothetical protein